MKKKLETICVVIVLILSIANIKICADAINILGNNAEKMHILKDNIENQQDLMGKGRVSRIAPKTEVEAFVEQLGLDNKEVEIYKDIEKQEKIEEGLVATGMAMTLKEEGKIEGTDYELSIVGDITRDGKANIVEAVQIINHIVEFEGKELTGLSYISGDINGDKEINIVDVTQLIRYIVFEELEIGEMVWEEPLVEEGIPEKEIGKIYAIEDLVDLATMVNNGTFEEEYRKVHGEEAQIVVTLERNLDFKDAKTYRTENPETMPYIDGEGNGIDANGDGIVDPIMTELTTGIGFRSIGIIDYEKQTFIPFKGSFDGKGNTISGLYINITEEEFGKLSSRLQEEYGENAEQVLGNLGQELMNRALGIGLFGAIEAGENETVEIKNLTIENANLKAGMALTQAPIAFTTGSGDFKFTNLNIKKLNLENNSESDEKYCAGIVGMTMGIGNHTFTECDVDNFTTQGGVIVAGILAGNQQKIDIEISKCNVTDSEISGMGSAGIMGVSMASMESGNGICNAIIKDCNVSNTDISGMISSGIAIATGLEGSLIENCHISKSNIIGNYYTGGIIATQMGTFEETNESKIIGCSSTDNNMKCSGIVGGIVGIVTGGKVDIVDCNIKGGTLEYLAEDVIEVVHTAGGIVGVCMGSGYDLDKNIINIYECSSEGFTLTAEVPVGGICGSVFDYVTVNIDKCYNESDLPSGGAGILCYSYKAFANITNCYNSGDIGKLNGNDEVDNISAGIYGVRDRYATHVGILNCYNTGDAIGGIVAIDDAGVTVENCYTIGNNIVGTIQMVDNPEETTYTTITNCHELIGEETPEQKANVLEVLNDQVELNNAEEDTIIWSTWVIDGDTNKGYPIFDWMIQN